MRLIFQVVVLIAAFFLNKNNILAQDEISLDSKSGVKWFLKPVEGAGENLDLTMGSFNQDDWIPAIVPGTAFVSYVEAGKEADPNFGDNIYQIDKGKYDRDFWYRTSFNTPKNFETTKKLWLNFEGINRKGDIYLNGTLLGQLDGFMDDGLFDISAIVNTTKPNVLLVKVYWPHTPIANYAMPAYMASASWDWMPYVPGLNMGITDNVYLKLTGKVRIVDPWIRTDIPDLSDLKEATVSIDLDLVNEAPERKNGMLNGTIMPGNIQFSHKVELDSQEVKHIRLDAHQISQLILEDPKLWWPNGYGEPNLYQCILEFVDNEGSKEIQPVTFGIKKYTYDYPDGKLQININGRPIFVKGGNWGMSEYLLRCRDDEYDLKLKLHKEMNLNMVRNWIGSVTDNEFYAACDRYGIMVWDDFWLNSHPNLPRDVFAFNKNAVNKIKRLRNHPSIAIWCGDNEGTPLPPLNNWLAENVKVYDGGDRLYQANSHENGLSGSGPWRNFDPQWYFTKYPGGFGGEKGWGFRTEIGTAVFTTFESFKKFMPADKWWPRNELWDKHFFGPRAGNAGPDIYEKTIASHYGLPKGIEDFCRKAQLLNMEVNKAMYEGWLANMGKGATGIMTWMSQSAYPSLVWQTYDYYYDLNGAYWGVKKACEPLHVLWNQANNEVEIVNTSGQFVEDLDVRFDVYNMDGKAVKDFSRKQNAQTKPGEVTGVFHLNFDLDNLALGKLVTASSVADESRTEALTDGSSGSRWTSAYSDDEWVYVDLGKETTFRQIDLVWEEAYAASYRLQVSDDAKSWKTLQEVGAGKGGTESFKFVPTRARYIRVLGLKRATEYGYSLYELNVYNDRRTRLSPVHFIKLSLVDKSGKIISDNLYWRGTTSGDYTSLNDLKAVKLKHAFSIKKAKDRIRVTGTVVNPKSAGTVAFAVKVQAVKVSTGERILPMITNDDYFSLMPGEKKDIEIVFDKKLLGDDRVQVLVESYNNY
ncbi:discoidin domain-containing protein [Olivibacter sp. CPCC 100613]|uniref:discoidin domain-containing protein n=1 Tax=Olivibacter sp. CPCC 100613 TaxID=3079931 RepID=UPI002FFD218F